MTDNIIAAVSRLLTPEVMSKMASATGLDTTTVQRAASASVPAILGGLADLAAKPGGARQLASTIAEQPTGLLSTLTSSIAGNGQLQQKGGSILTSLLGSDTHSALVSSVSKVAGIGEAPVRALTGLLTPVILGALGSQQRAAGMEASGLARMLMDQKDQIVAAMPSGLSGMFDASSNRANTRPLLRPEAHLQDAPQAAYAHYRATNADIQRAVGDATANAGSGWAYWALPLLALAGLLWYLLPSGQTPNPTLKTGDTSSTVAQTVPKPGDKSFYLTQVPAGWRSVGAFRNQDVYNRNGDKIGSVKDVLIGPTGSAAVIGIGHHLGIGAKDIAVPLAALKTQQRNNSPTLTLDVANELLRSAPSFGSAGVR